MPGVDREEESSASKAAEVGMDYVGPCKLYDDLIFIQWAYVVASGLKGSNMS